MLPSAPPPTIDAMNLNTILRAFLCALALYALTLSAHSPPVAAQDETEAEAAPPPEKHLLYPIVGEINSRMFARMQKDIDRYIEEENVRDVIFEFNTGGGEVEAGLEISGYIFGLDDRDVRTYGYVPRNSQALSAGTMLALACRTLVMGKNAHIGDVQPINSFTREELPEKIQTFVRSSLRAYAIDRGYSEALVNSMVTKELEVLRIQGLDENGNRFERFVTTGELEQLSDDVRNRIDKQEQIVEAGQILTISSAEALEYGFIQNIISERSDLLNTYGLTNELIIHGETAGTRTFDTGSWLPIFGHPFAKFLMILIGVLGLAIEMKAPGLGFPGIIGVLAFIAFFGVGIAGGTVGTIEVVLFVSAIILLACEVFVIPGFGIAGVLGLAFLLASLTLALMTGTGEFHKEEILSASQVVIYSIAASMLLVLVVIHFLPKTGRFANSGLISTAVLDKTAHPGARDANGLPIRSPLVGKTGVVVSALRPAGKVEIGPDLHDVVSDSGFLAVGTRIKVHAVEGNRIVVEALEE